MRHGRRRFITRSGLVENAIAVGVLVLAAVGVATTSVQPAVAHNTPSPYLDGNSAQCSDWKIRFLNLGFTEFDVDIAEEGWVWVDSQRKLQSASGVATKSKVANNDTPANHYSHDWNVDIRVDPGQEYLLSDVNGRDITSDVPQKIELEWETGIRPSQTSGLDDEPWFPAWVTPSVGDRVWTNGHWVFDCGHASGVKTPIPVEDDPSSCPAGLAPVPFVPGPGQPLQWKECQDQHFRSEIHPGRAIAAMRSQTATLPGTGTTPVPVTATDLYIHGRGGFMIEQLHCGIGIILDDETCATKTTPIADQYQFDICLPPRPAPQAQLKWSVTTGPGNTVAGEPELEDVVAVGGCVAPADEYGNDFDDGTMVRATVDLTDSGATPEDVYARHIDAGWVYPTAVPARHLSLRLDQMDLHEDHEGPGFNGELSFIWMNVDRAPSQEWHRLAGWDIPTYDSGGEACFDFYNTLNNYDDDNMCGVGLLNFSGPTYDFYLRPGQTFGVHARGFEQDCYDENFGDGEFSLLEYAECHGGDPTEIEDWGNNDKLADLDQVYPSTIAPGRYEPSGYDDDLDREYELEFEVTEIPLVDEDTADLSVAKECTYPGEVALAGEPFTCTVTVTNNGPGLPRNVVVSDTPTTTLSPEDYTIGEPTATVGAEAAPVGCTKFRDTTKFSCFVGSIPVGSTATMTVDITPDRPARFDNTAAVTTDSTDPVAGNNSASDSVEVFLPIPLDVQPGDELGATIVDRQGTIPVAVLTTPTFDATTLNVATLCFGDAGAPLERDCTETHGKGHPVDIDKDRDNDLLLHYSLFESGIDPGDTRACLIGRTQSGVGVYGCDEIRGF